MGGEEKPIVTSRSQRLHQVIGIAVMLVDLGFVAAVLLLNHYDPRTPPSSGSIDTSAAVGWVGTFGAIIAFGCYGVLIKTPAVQAANVDTMIFQCYYSAGVALLSALIWLFNGQVDSVQISAWGFVFALLWVLSQLSAFNAIKALGYAVGPAVWAGLSVLVSFVWGVCAFDDPVKNPAGTAFGLILLTLGICLAAASQSSLPTHIRQLLEKKPAHDSDEESRGVLISRETQKSASPFLYGIAMAVTTGLLNGSLMVPLRCFDHGCLGLPKHEGSGNTSVAFLPSLSVAVLLVTPVVFALYFRFQLPPSFHIPIAALPGFLTGCFWASGNFCSMWATLYLGQTVGFPLTQTCIVVNGLWGILYFNEITGPYAIGVFVFAVVIIIVGAVLDGMYA